MGFHEVTYPINQDYGSSGGPGFNTKLTRLQSGGVTAYPRWGGAGIRRYNAVHGVKSPADFATLLDFYIARGGGSNGFRWKDWHDFSTAVDHTAAPAFDDHSLGFGDGSATQFQLVKRYLSATGNVVRTLRKPVANTTVAGLDGAEITVGTSFSVDTTTGIITLTSPVGVGVEVTAGCQFDVPVYFATSLDEWLQMAVDDYGQHSIPGDVIVEEMLDEVLVDDDFFYGGAKTLTFSTSINITPATGRALRLSASSPGLTAYLPAPALFPLGGPHWFIQVVAGTNSVVFKTGNTTWFTIGAGNTQTICNFDVGGTPTWVAF